MPNPQYIKLVDHLAFMILKYLKCRDFSKRRNDVKIGKRHWVKICPYKTYCKSVIVTPWVYKIYHPSSPKTKIICKERNLGRYSSLETKLIVKWMHVDMTKHVQNIIV